MLALKARAQWIFQKARDHLSKNRGNTVTSPCFSIFTLWNSEEREGWKDPVQAGRGKQGNPHQKEEIRRPRPRGLWGERKEAQETAKDRGKQPRAAWLQAWKLLTSGLQKHLLLVSCPQASGLQLFYKVDRKNMGNGKERKGKKRGKKDMKSGNQESNRPSSDIQPCSLPAVWLWASITSGKREQKHLLDLAPQGCYEDQTRPWAERIAFSLLLSFYLCLSPTLTQSHTGWLIFFSPKHFHKAGNCKVPMPAEPQCSWAWP